MQLKRVYDFCEPNQGPLHITLPTHFSNYSKAEYKAVARTTPSRMKHPTWLSDIGTFCLDSDMDQIEQMRDALPDNHDLDQLTSHMSSLFSSPESSLRTSPMAAATGVPSLLTVVSPLTASVWSPTDIYMPPQRRLLQQGTTRSEMSSPLSDSLSTASSGIQEKTILCKFFQKGVCSKGDGCTFAHGISDIKAARSGRSRDTESSNTRRKTKLCRNLFVDGICPYGDNCDFAHGVNDLKCTATAAAADEQGNVDLSQLIQLPELRQVSEKNYKTKICKHFFKTGKCWLEGECHFAHGTSELKKTR